MPGTFMLSKCSNKWTKIPPRAPKWLIEEVTKEPRLTCKTSRSIKGLQAHLTFATKHSADEDFCDNLRTHKSKVGLCEVLIDIWRGSVLCRNWHKTQRNTGRLSELSQDVAIIPLPSAYLVGEEDLKECGAKPRRTSYQQSKMAVGLWWSRALLLLQNVDLT